MTGGAFLRPLLAKVVPGSPLREGLERVLRARMGALIVLGDQPEVLQICSGGFHLDAEFSPQRLSELAKMDGAIVLDAEATRIAWANVHLVPDSSIPTSETGTRHRTAERVARGGVPVIAVSEEMGTITLYLHDLRHQLRPTEQLLARTTYLLRTLERFRQRYDEADAALTAAEISEVVTAAEVAFLLQRSEMLLRVADEVDGLIDELGENGRLLRLQLAELVAGVGEEQVLVLEDYLGNRPAPDGRSWADEALRRLHELPTEDLLGIERFVGAFDGAGSDPSLDAPLEPLGLRLLHRLPDLAPGRADELAERFGGLHALVRATGGELSAAGLSEDEAQLLKDGLARLAEGTLLEPYR